jgi:hypothetical protein
MRAFSCTFTHRECAKGSQFAAAADVTGKEDIHARRFDCNVAVWGLLLLLVIRARVHNVVSPATRRNIARTSNIFSFPMSELGARTTSHTGGMTTYSRAGKQTRLYGEIKVSCVWVCLDNTWIGVRRPLRRLLHQHFAIART